MAHLLRSIVGITLGLAVACGSGDPELTREELLDPAACQSCHPDHYRQWLGSSHAYAADDPVFLAMNARYQRDTNGAFESDCVRCHAPVALAEGATTSGLDLDTVAAELKGVTCYACHVVADANPSTHTFELADDGVMRGGVDRPRSTGAHSSAYSALFDREEWRSTDLCGACHDFETRSGVHVHRTHTSWTQSLFADTFSRSFLSCNGCHMAGETAPIATDGPARRRHDHKFPGVNVALMDWPEKQAQLDAIAADLGPALRAKLCLNVTSRPEVTLDNVMSGHMWPSGDAFTRRAWVELVAYDADDNVIFQSGVIEDGTPVVSTRESDPNLWLLWDRLEDSDGNDVTFSWNAADVESDLLPPTVTTDPSDPRYYHAVSREYPSLPSMPARMTMRVHIRPIGLDVIDELVDGGDLDGAVRSKIPTFTLAGTVLEWTGAVGSCEPAGM